MACCVTNVEASNLLKRFRLQILDSFQVYHKMVDLNEGLRIKEESVSFEINLIRRIFIMDSSRCKGFTYNINTK